MLPNLPLFFINRTLKGEDWARQRLCSHAGQTARLQIGSLDMRFTVDVDGLLMAAARDATDDVTVSLPASALGVIAENPAEITRYAHIEGSAALADTLATLLQHLRPDLAGWLAPYVGDVLAVRATRTAGIISRTGMAAARQGESVLKGLVQDHLHAATPHAEFDAWKSELEELARRLEKLESRVRR